MCTYKLNQVSQHINDLEYLRHLCQPKLFKPAEILMAYFEFSSFFQGTSQSFEATSLKQEVVPINMQPRILLITVSPQLLLSVATISCNHQSYPSLSAFTNSHPLQPLNPSMQCSIAVSLNINNGPGKSVCNWPFPPPLHILGVCYVINSWFGCHLKGIVPWIIFLS